MSILESVYDSLELVSPAIAEGKHIYRGMRGKYSMEQGSYPYVKFDWISWLSQLRNVKIPRNLMKDMKKVKAVCPHTFADGSSKAVI